MQMKINTNAVQSAGATTGMVGCSCFIPVTFTRGDELVRKEIWNREIGVDFAKSLATVGHI